MANNTAKATMKPLLFLLGIFLYLNCSAQRISYEQLQKMYFFDLEETEDYLATQGFRFEGIDTLGDKKDRHLYNFVKNNSSPNNYLSITKWEANGRFYDITLDTYSQSDYLAIKNAVKKNRFERIHFGPNNNGGIIEVFKKNPFECSFEINYHKTDNITSYFISFSSPMLKEAIINNQ